MTPTRIQRSRVRGWKSPPDTIYVGRPSRWGNPYKVREADGCAEYGIHIPAITVDDAVHMFRHDLADKILRIENFLGPLRGKSLGCWCALDQPCHADVLLEVANLPAADQVLWCIRERRT